jgi:hypothetical protein
MKPLKDIQALTDETPPQPGGNAYDRMRELFPRVYVAGPYTQGDREANVRENLRIASLLIDKGYAPYAPLLTHYQHEAFPRDPSDWLSLDLAWLEKANCLLRTPGASRGADIEVAFCKARGIPVFYTIEDMERHYGSAN